MRKGWMHVSGFEGQERFAPRTLAECVLVDDSESKSILQAVNEGLATIPTEAEIEAKIQALMPPPPQIPEPIVQARYVNASGSVSETEAENRYLQYFNRQDNTWEWVNTPDLDGVYYQTVERWNGKKVYSRYLDLGLSNVGANKIINLGFESVDRKRLIKFDYYFYIPNSNKWFTGYWSGANIQVSGDMVIINNTYPHQYRYYAKFYFINID